MATFNLIDKPHTGPLSIDDLYQEINSLRQQLVTIHVHTTGKNITTQYASKHIKDIYTYFLLADSKIIPMIERLYEWAVGLKELQSEVAVAERFQAYQLASEIFAHHMEWFNTFINIVNDGDIFNEVSTDDLIITFKRASLGISRVKELTA